MIEVLEDESCGDEELGYFASGSAFAANAERSGAVVVVTAKRRVQPPLGVVLATVLYCAEFVISAVMTGLYHRTNDSTWMGFTIFFMIFPAVLIQFTLTFIHRDLGRDRPLVLLMHMLLLGPVIRCLEALVIYFKKQKMDEEPYVSISRKRQPRKGDQPFREFEIGQRERKLATHRNAFKRTTVIQAFLGSTPQLTLQLFATIQEKYILRVRLALMIITLVSITYGALVCSVLAIRIQYDGYMVRLRPLGYLFLVMWRALEIATRVTTLVLFSTALSHWMILVGTLDMAFFFFLPWVLFWVKKGSLAQDVEKNISKLGTVLVLCMFTLLYACINIFCWSAVQLDLAQAELIEKKEDWRRLMVYYIVRFVENFTLITLWYFYKTDFYEYVCTPLVVIQLLILSILSVLFMMLFLQYGHPCRRLFKHNVHDCLECVCCQKGGRSGSGRSLVTYANAATMPVSAEMPLNQRQPSQGDVEDTLQAA